MSKGFSQGEKVDRLRKAETLIYVIKMCSVAVARRVILRRRFESYKHYITFFDIYVINNVFINKQINFMTYGK